MLLQPRLMFSVCGNLHQFFVNVFVCMRIYNNFTSKRQLWLQNEFCRFNKYTTGFAIVFVYYFPSAVQGKFTFGFNCNVFDYFFFIPIELSMKREKHLKQYKVL